MSEIPEDVMVAAMKAYDDGFERFAGNKIEAIAQAILAEREACAKIAEEWEKPEKLLPMCSDEYNHVADVGMIEAQQRISGAIRRR